MRPGLAAARLGLVLAGLMAGNLAAQAADNPLEYAVKAAYLAKFAPFIAWPDATFASATAPLNICILGADRFGGALDKDVEGQKDSEHPLSVRRLATFDPGAPCQILFTGDSQFAPDAADLAHARPVVTVTDSGIAPAGIISFVIVGDHVRFDIDAATADAMGIKISSKLLGLAHAVRQKGER